MNFDKLIQGIEKARRVISALIPLILEIGTLAAVIKMIIESIR